MLPRITYAPTAVGFCLYIKSSILIDFGVFDEIYGLGYNEENDLILRANKFGYRAVIANHAYAWHLGSASFNAHPKSTPQKRDDQNAKILHGRYPEYLELTDLYRRSPDYRSERLISSLVPDKDGCTKIAFDLSAFGADFNGTREAGKRLVIAAANNWPMEIRIIVLMSRDSWFFFGFDACKRLEWGDINESQNFAVIIRFGQPFHPIEMTRLLARAPVIGVFMLDTIAADSGYLRIQFPEELWRFTLEHVDLIFTNSEFTLNQILRRYHVGPNVKTLASLHSMTPKDYCLEHPAPIDDPHGDLLIIGNSYTHKAIIPTTILLANKFPTLKIGCLGAVDAVNLPNVTTWPSGKFTEKEMNELYLSYRAVVFPSHYEGFGLPLMHALSRKRPIFIRRLPAFLEIVNQLNLNAANVIWFENNTDLVRLLSSNDLAWQGSEIVGEIDGWARSAREVYREVALAVTQVQLTQVANRLRWFELAFPRNWTSPFMPTRFNQAIELLVEFLEGAISPWVRGRKVRDRLAPRWDNYRLKRRLKT
jgi:glycosyltransferase involved in cell wall biosynthesis